MDKTQVVWIKHRPGSGGFEYNTGQIQREPGVWLQIQIQRQEAGLGMSPSPGRTLVTGATCGIGQGETINRHVPFSRATNGPSIVPKSSPS